MASPSKSSKKQMEQLNMRLETAVLAQLDRMAAERSTTRSDVLRTLLAAWMRDPSSVVVGFPVIGSAK
ncbi:hypothetical protein [Cupriavidus malaysiensis]|uniref:Ribbon-helix-helix protein CopG domain-containing protein n=1 Tax=Cupriavidus malaysiensis TaxID=367825 RepID=A0ABM6F356_9BURK|nr:hypothetical protein [Cupriavidus malaysiensis]AOZ05817.1 hypothetical protein BKK80_08335 [Cupriavidus malaysiensis]